MVQFDIKRLKGIAISTDIGSDLTKVTNPRDPRDKALKAQAKASMRHRSKASQVEVGLVITGVKLFLFLSSLKILLLII